MALGRVAVLAAAVAGLAAAAAPSPGAPADVVPFGSGLAAGQSSTTLSSATLSSLTTSSLTTSSLTLATGTDTEPVVPSSLTLSDLTLSTGTYVVGLFDTPVFVDSVHAPFQYSNLRFGHSDFPVFVDGAAWSAGAPDLHGLWVVTQAWHAGTATDADVYTELWVLAANGTITDEWVRERLLLIHGYVGVIEARLHCHDRGTC